MQQVGPRLSRSVYRGPGRRLCTCPRDLTHGLRLRLPPRACQQQQHRGITALLAPAGLGEAFVALPGGSKDGRGVLSVPVPDPRLDRLAHLERTKAVPAVVEVLGLEQALSDELHEAVSEELGGRPPELSGKLLGALRSSDAIVIAVPCGSGDEGAPVAWLQAAERILIAADLAALEHQVCEGGAGADSPIDTAKLRKALAGSGNATVRREAEELVKSVVAPGLASLRARLRAGLPVREARPGLEPLQAPAAGPFADLDPRFGDLASGWLSLLVTWRPVLLLADVPEADAGSEAAAASPLAGNAASQRLTAYAAQQGMPCLTVCTTLEGESVALSEEPEFLREYLASLGLVAAEAAAEGGQQLWHSRCGDLVRHIPPLENLPEGSRPRQLKLAASCYSRLKRLLVVVRDASRVWL